jgi:hypothetical protein
MKSTNFIMGGLAAVIFALWLYAVGCEWRTSLDTLFSGLAFIGVVWAILVQRQELKAQQKELKLTRKVFKEQNTTSRKQRFENTFFQLLSVFIEKGALFQFNHHKKTQGLTAFRELADEVKSKIRPSEPKETEAGQLLHEYAIVRGYSELIGYFQYLRNLFLVLDYVRDSPLIEEPERAFYFNVFRSQISAEELFILSLEVVYVESDVKGAWMYQELNRMKFFEGMGNYKYHPPVAPFAQFFPGKTTKT